MNIVAVKEHPILFPGDMVRAILDGKELQVRVIKIPHCPYGQLGDRLRVTETWRIGAWNIDTSCIAIDYKADGFCRREWLQVNDPVRFERYAKQSTLDAKRAGFKPDADGNYHWKPGESPCRWRSGRFMQANFSRIFLELTNVRAKRLQDIIKADAIAEGTPTKAYPVVDYDGGYIVHEQGTWIGEFSALWDSINAECDYPWDSNPWVRVLTFKVLEANR